MIRLAACLVFYTVGLIAQQEHEPAAIADTSYSLPDISFDDAILADRPAPSKQSDVSFQWALGLSTGGGFGDALTADLKDQGYLTAGRMVFFNVELGMELRAKDHFFISPSVRWLHTTLKRESGFTSGSDDLTMFSMLTCGIGCRYYLREALPYTFYVQGELGSLMTASKISGIIFSSDVLSGGLLAGYAYEWKTRAIGFEIGYRSIPVSHPRSSVRYGSGRAVIITENDRKDFGGMFINVVWRLDVLNSWASDE